MSLLQPILKPIAEAVLQGLYGPNLGLVFHALTYDPDTYEMLGVKTGTGDLTEARIGTDIYAADHEGVYRAFGSGEPAYKGGRVVENLALYSGDATQINGGVNFNNTNTATTITFGSGDGYRYKKIDNGLLTNGNTATIRITVSSSDKSTIGIVLYDGSVFNYKSVTLTPTPQTITVSSTIVSNSNCQFGLDNRAGKGGDGLPGTVTVTDWQWEDTTGRSDTTTPSEYVPTTTAAAKKVFANANGNSVDGSNVVTEAVGQPLPARTVENRAKHSQDSTGWTAAAAGTGSAPTLTDNYATAPDGTATAMRLQCDRGASDTTSDYSALNDDIVAKDTSNPNDVFSVWVKSNTGSSQTFVWYAANNSQTGGAEYTATTSWQRINMRVGTTDNTDPAGVIGLRGGSDTRFSGGGQTLDILIWGYQYEDATGRVIDNFGTIDTEIPSEYVATTTAAASQTFYGELKNTVSSNVVTEADAAAGPIPVLAQPALTNSLTYSKPDTSNWTLTEGAKNLGSDQVTNGGFATDTDWSKGDGWTISGGTASCDGTQTEGSLLGQSISFTEGEIYKMTYTVSNYSAGAVRIQSNNNVGTHRSANGTYTEYIGPMFANQTNLYVRAESDFIGDIDNVIVEEVEQLVVNGDFAAGDDGNWTKGTGWSIGSGVASCDGTQTANTNLIQNVGLTTDTIYKITFTVSNYSAGNVKGFAGYTYLGTDVSANGTYTQYIRASNSSAGVRANSSFIGDIDDVIVIPAVIESTTTGLDGASDSAVVLTDDDGSAYEGVKFTTTVVDDTNTHTARFYVKKDSDETRFPEFALEVTGGSVQREYVMLNTSTGATSTRLSTGTTDHDVRDAGDWWELLISVANNGTGNTSATIPCSPALATTIGAPSTAATGSITIGNVELHENTTIAEVRGSGFIATSGSSVTTNASDLSFDDANHDDTQGAWFCEYTTVGLTGTSSPSNKQCMIGVGGSGRFFLVNTLGGPFKAYDGTNVPSGPSVSIDADDTAYKLGLAYGGSNMRVNTDGSWGVESAYDGAFDNANGKIQVMGSETSLSGPAPSTNLIRNIRRYDLPYDEAQVKIDDLMS